MNSHLHRLAERALGRTRSLRALAEGPVLGADTPAEVGDAPTPVGRNEALPSTVVQARSEPTGQALPAQRVASPRTEHLYSAAEPRRTSSDQRQNTPPTNDPEIRATHPAEPTHAADPDDLAPTPVRGEPSLLLPVAVVRDAGLQMPLQRPQPTQAQDQNQNPMGEPANPPSTTRSDEPPPLMPRVLPAQGLLPPLHLPSRAMAAKPEERQPANAVEETTEVHVSIGRIEVTAVQAPAATAPAAPRRRQAPMSLDDYIAHRQGGRS
jgi:hypothetical protein